MRWNQASQGNGSDDGRASHSETTMKLPAMAVVGPDGRIVRSTETFRRRYEPTRCAASPELERVLTGQADVATVELDELRIAVEAVTDASGRRQVLLTLPPVDADPPAEHPLFALREAAEASRAIVWVKDLERCHLYGNPRYAETLSEHEAVDAPRGEEGREAPLHLEYELPASDERPALSVFRFALRDDTGRPVATCGVASPTAEAEVARAEAVHLMQLERWNRLDPIEVRAELLEQWHLRPVEPVSRPTEAPMPAPPPTDTAGLLQTDLRMARRWADRAEALQNELQEALAAAARAAEEADHWRSELEQTRLELASARAQVEALRSPSAPVLRLPEIDFEPNLDPQAGARARTT